jgi:serine/threonine protein kinase
MESKTVANKYRLIEPIGNGAFGYIYKALNIRNGQQVALKMEPLMAETKMLKNETKIYQYLNGQEGIPNVLWFGVDDKNFYMAIDLLGPSLQKIRDNSKPFSLKLAVSISRIIVKRLECIHQRGLIHRDVKPDNFLFGLGEKNKLLYLIDFEILQMHLWKCSQSLALGQTSNYPMWGCVQKPIVQGHAHAHALLYYAHSQLAVPHFSLVSLNYHAG